ncbi:MAG: NAD(P) transhydrogenase subunit alpha [Neisseriaceae bacterium]|nr:NAD(P) transhydrogenase subunit alpha [Neisseriaceae bacterium]
MLGAAVILFIGAVAPETPKEPDLLSHLVVFALSCVIGYYVVWNVTHSLHMPLMSVTNAISGIIIVGALLQISQGYGFASLLAFIGIFLVSINIFGGFFVTRRMLNMFRKG